MTKIEWADVTWNPVTGCSPVSEACENCYAKRMAQRLKGRFGYPKDDPFRVTLHYDRLNQPFQKWKKPKRIFVVSMADLFHPDVDDAFLLAVTTRMHFCRMHTYMVLTKRPERMRDWFNSFYDEYYTNPNIWLGVTAENQARADERIPVLLQIPAAVRFVSIEPMLGPLSFRWSKWHPLNRTESTGHLDGLRRLDWVIIGGETGPGARPMHPDWVRSVRDQCQEAGVPFFFKQWGEWWQPSTKTEALKDFKSPFYDHESGMFKVGKKAAGRLLDGQEWNEFPELET